MKRWKRIHIGLFIDGKEHHHAWSAVAGGDFVQPNVEAVLQHISSYLRQRHPGRRFRVVKLAPNKFNFIAEEISDRTLRNL